ncbi:MAG: nitroreductase family protein [Oscillatoriaceae cyanobacterium Prado104]|jgi:SagB-type dehydrogenase family enzyme|nr:nitroreductase family protein [Oscillatoriaceae cyanobacterium Prado104]
MLSSSTIEGKYRNKYHEATKHSAISVQLDPNYVDATTQPVAFKKYPKFFRRFPLELDNPFHQFLSLTSAITFQKQYRDGTHSLRVQPSAGALYPTEIYVQLRGISGMLDGIYHLEQDSSTLTLIYELIDDGLEGYFSDDRPIKGCIFLVSCVYFRSSWKYKNRSLRYCFLDSGHHLGAIEASAIVSNYSYQLLFDLDRAALNDDLGFENKEFVAAVAIAGEPKDKKAVRRLRSPLPFVSATDYFEPNLFIEEGYKQTFVENCEKQPIKQPKFPFESSQILQAIQRRRSARRFNPSPIELNDFLTVCTALQQPIPSENAAAFEIYAVVQRVTGMQSGLYKIGDSNYCLKLGDFHDRTGYLCINQAIARDSAAVFFIVSDCGNYQLALQQAGFVGQRIYLAAENLKFGCSGIGAFFDDETQAFLETDLNVLYAIAIGNLCDRDRIK